MRHYSNREISADGSGLELGSPRFKFGVREANGQTAIPYSEVSVSSYIYFSKDSTEGLIHRVNLAEVITGYPLLASSIQETLRVQSTNTMLEDQYLLKKGSKLLIPSAELHNNISGWGPSYKDFDPQRFMQK